MKTQKECLEILIENKGDCFQLDCTRVMGTRDDCPFFGNEACKYKKIKSTYEGAVRLYVKLYGKGALVELLL